MRPSPAVAMALLAGALLAGRAAGQSFTVDGACMCVGDCARTIDGFLTPWCYTSPQDPPPGTYCGKFSQSRRAYWSECVPNVTGTTESRFVTSFSDMSSVMTVSSIIICSALYAVAGCVASALTSPRRTFYWLPVAAALLGGCQGFFVGAPFAVILSFLYLSMPYAIDWNVAVALGTALGVLVVYAGMGRAAKPFDAPHASELE